jgi:2,4-dienoyl-CoA reductase-like NADH-dependent reductase (Old Yellow Enzyme family)
VEDFKPEELPVIVDHHAKAARRAVLAGFDFIEIHLAHAYTLASFLSRSNKRTDTYGAKLGHRLRLPTEVYEPVREVVGENYPVGIRINGEDFTATEVLCSRACAWREDSPDSELTTSVFRQEVDSRMQHRRPRTPP